MCVPDSPFSSLHVFIVLAMVLDGSASRILSSFCANNTLNTMRCDCIWLSLQWDGWLVLCIIVAGTGSVFMWHKQEEAQLHMFLCMVGLLHSCGHYSIRSGCFSCCWCMVLVQCHVWLPWWVMQEHCKLNVWNSEFIIRIFLVFKLYWWWMKMLAYDFWSRWNFQRLKLLIWYV